MATMLDKDLNELKIDDKKILKVRNEYRLHIVVLAIVIISELIGTITIPITNTLTITLMPLIYTLILGLALYLWKPFILLKDEQSTVAEGIILIAVGPLVAKLAISGGYGIMTIIHAGPALLLQEVGNLGTILFGLPIALLLGFKRESIGMSSSICREYTIGTIIDKFGFNSAESRGYFIVYLIGILVGTIFLNILTSILTSILPFHPYAFAMACGVGSGSLNAAAVAPLLHSFPAMSHKIQALSGVSNLVSICTVIYVYILVALPLTEKLYNLLEPIIGRNVKVDEIKEIEEAEKGIDHSSAKQVKSKSKLILHWILILLIFSIISAVGNFLGYSHPITPTFIGLLILSGIALFGLILEEIMPIGIPSVVYISVLGIVLALPWMPTSPIIMQYTNNVELLSIITVILGYSGIAMGKSWGEFRKVGWKGIIVTLFVLFGTYFCSLVIGQLAIGYWGIT